MAFARMLRRWRDNTAWHHILVANGPLWWTCRDCRACWHEHPKPGFSRVLHGWR